VDCDDVRSLLDAYADNELDLMTSLSIQKHLQTCLNCQPIYQNRLTLQAHLTAESSNLYFQAPAAVQTRLMLAFQAADRPVKPPNSFLTADRPLNRPWIGLLAVAGMLVIVGGIMIIVLVRGGSAPGTLDLVAQQVLTSHIRSLMANHLTDVTSTDQHTVKPWFDGKLDYVPPVIDLTGQGFPLLGGRLDYLDSMSVAALVYGSDKHLINVFVWPTTQTPQSVTTTNSPQGYHLIHWTQGQMNYWVISDVEESKLGLFVSMLRTQLPSS